MRTRLFTIIILTRPWPAFGRQGLVGSSFEYSYTRLASRLRRSARSGIMTLGKDKTPSLLEPSNLPIFQPSNIPTFRPSNLPTFPKRQCLETGELTKFLTFQPSDLPTFQPSNFPTFRPSYLPTFPNSV